MSMQHPLGSHAADLAELRLVQALLAKAESRLAAATALLVRARRLIAAEDLQDDIDAFLANQPAAPDYATAAQSASELMARVHAPLPGWDNIERKTAAPALPCRDPAEIDRASEWDMPPAPTRTALADALGDVKSGARVAPTRDETDEERAEMAQGFGFGDYATMVRLLARHGWSRTSTRAEAEQAVLDAMTALSELSVRYYCSEVFTASDSLMAILFRAELARRGLK